MHAQQSSGLYERFFPWLERNGLILLVAYFLLLGLLRPWVSSALEFDEAEQMLQTQYLSLGYGAQPPLFTWIMHFLFKIQGPSILALALVKNVLLFLSTLFLFLASRRIFRQTLPAIAVAFSFLLIPQFAWESQRTLTDSVLVTTCAAATFYLLVKIYQDGKLMDYAWLGLALGLGALSKYSFALFAPMLLGAALLTPALRQALLDRRILLSAGIAMAIALPHALWVMGHWHDATSPTLSKMNPQAHANPLWSFAIGWGQLALTTLLFLTPFWLIFLWARHTPKTRSGQPQSPWISLFLRYALLFALGMSLLMLVTQATSFRDRWLQPFLVLAPLALILAWPLSQAGLRRIITAALAVMILTFAALNSRPLVGGMLEKPQKINLPVERLAENLRQQGWTKGTILAENIHLAGNLKLHLSESKVHLPGRSFVPEHELQKECDILLVWDQPDERNPPSRLSDVFIKLYGQSWNEFPYRQATLSAPILYGTRPYSLHIIHIQNHCSS